MEKNQNRNSNQAGMVAITVTIILMIVISLIALGFSTTTRREQRQALDYQLASQAFYAAESGVNLATDKLKRAPDTQKNVCDASENGVFSPTDYNIGNGAAITCILINPNVTEVIIDSVGMNAQVGAISAASVINTITINWASASDAVSSCNGGSAFATTAAAWGCQQPLLRVDIVDINNPQNINVTNLKNSQFTAFLYPNQNTGDTPTYSMATGSNLGKIFQSKCVPGSPAKCSLSITTDGSSKSYGIRVMSLYRTSANVTIQAFNISNPSTPLPLIGSQAVIDVTARAQDVLKRVQARVNLASSGNNGYVPDFALDSRSGLCKRYSTNGYQAPSDPGIPAGTTECKTAPPY